MNDDEETAPSLTQAAIAVGKLVDVASRTWPGINKEGGIGRVIAVHPSANDSKPTHVDVQYIVRSSKERRIPIEYVQLATDFEENELPSRKKLLRDRSMLLGRCRRCGSLRADCGSCDWANAIDDGQASTSKSHSRKSQRNRSNAPRTNRRQALDFQRARPMTLSSDSESDEEWLNQLIQARKLERNQALAAKSPRQTNRADAMQLWLASSSSDSDDNIPRHQSMKERPRSNHESTSSRKRSLKSISARHGGEADRQQFSPPRHQKSPVTSGTGDDRFSVRSYSSDTVSSSSVYEEDSSNRMDTESEDSHHEDDGRESHFHAHRLESKTLSTGYRPDIHEDSELNAFIQPEGAEAVEELPEDVLDETLALEFHELPSFFEKKVLHLEDEAIPDAKLTIALFDKKAQEVIQQASNNQVLALPTRDLLSECESLSRNFVADLVREGLDQCRICLRRLSNSKAYRAARSNLTNEQRKECRSGRLMEARNLRMDAIEEDIQHLMGRLKDIRARLLEIDEPIDMEGVDVDSFSDAGDTALPQSPSSSIEGDENKAENVKPMRSFHRHMHASKVRDPDAQPRKKSKRHQEKHTSRRRKKRRTKVDAKFCSTRRESQSESADQTSTPLGVFENKGHDSDSDLFEDEAIDENRDPDCTHGAVPDFDIIVGRQRGRSGEEFESSRNRSYREEVSAVERMQRFLDANQYGIGEEVGDLGENSSSTRQSRLDSVAVPNREIESESGPRRGNSAMSGSCVSSTSLFNSLRSDLGEGVFDTIGSGRSSQPQSVIFSSTTITQELTEREVEQNTIAGATNHGENDRLGDIVESIRSSGVFSIVEMATMGRTNLQQYVKLLVALLRSLVSTSDASPNSALVRVVLISYVDALYAIFQPAAWVFESPIAPLQILYDLEPLQKALVLVFPSFMERLCRFLLLEFPRQQWRWSVYLNRGIVSSVDPEMWDKAMLSRQPGLIESTGSRWVAFGGTYPRAEIEAMWQILAYNARGVSPQADGHSSFQWKLIEDLLLSPCGVFPTEFGDSSPVASPLHIDRAENEVEFICILLEVGVVRSVPKTDDILRNILMLSTDLQKSALCSVGSGGSEWPCAVGDAAARKRRIQEIGRHKTHESSERVQDITSLSKTERAMLWKTWGQSGSILRPLSGLFSLCARLLALYTAIVPEKQARQKRFQNTLKLVDRHLGSNLSEHKDLEASRNGESDFATAFGSSPSSRQRATFDGRHAYSIESIFFFFESHAIVQLGDGYKLMAVEYLWSKFAPQGLNFVRDNVISAQTTILASATVNPLVALSMSKVLISAALRHLALCPWTKEAVLPVPPCGNARASTMFAVSGMFACWECLIEATDDKSLLSTMVELMSTLFAAMVKKCGAIFSSPITLYEKNIMVFGLATCEKRFLSAKNTQQGGVMDDLEFHALVAMSKLMFEFLNMVADVPEQVSVAPDDFWSDLPDEAFQDLDVGTGGESLCSGHNVAKGSKIASISLQDQALRLFQTLFCLVLLAKPSTRYKIPGESEAATIPGKLLLASHVDHILLVSAEVVSLLVRHEKMTSAEMRCLFNYSQPLGQCTTNREDIDFLRGGLIHFVASLCQCCGSNGRLGRALADASTPLVLCAISSLFSVKGLAALPTWNNERILELGGENATEKNMAVIEIMNDEVCFVGDKRNKKQQKRLRRKIRELNSAWDLIRSIHGILQEHHGDKHLTEALTHVVVGDFISDIITKALNRNLPGVSLEMELLRRYSALFCVVQASLSSGNSSTSNAIVAFSVKTLVFAVVLVARSLEYVERSEQGLPSQSKNLSSAKLTVLMSNLFELFISLVCGILARVPPGTRDGMSDLMTTVRDRLLLPLIGNEPFLLSSSLHTIVTTACNCLDHQIDIELQVFPRNLESCLKNIDGGVILRAREFVLYGARSLPGCQEGARLIAGLIAHAATLDIDVDAPNNLPVSNIAMSLCSRSASPSRRRLSTRESFRFVLDVIVHDMSRSDPATLLPDGKLASLRSLVLSTTILPKLYHERTHLNVKQAMMRLIGLLFLHSSTNSPFTLLDCCRIVHAMFSACRCALLHPEAASGFLIEMLLSSRRIAVCVSPEGGTESIAAWSRKASQNVSSTDSTQLESQAVLLRTFFRWVAKLCELILDMTTDDESLKCIMSSFQNREGNVLGSHSQLHLDWFSLDETMKSLFDKAFSQSRTSSSHSSVVNVYSKVSRTEAGKSGTLHNPSIRSNGVCRRAKEFLSEIVAYL